MSTVLNPVLYSALVAHFGRVVIANQGAGATYLPRLRTDGSLRMEPKYGEAYRVNCPLCGDQGHRLYFNHLWCTYDATHNYPTKYLLRCFHTDDTCVTESFINELEHRLLLSLTFAPVGYSMVVQQGDIELAPAEVELPGQLVSLRELSPDHTAMRYLLERQYDPYWLADTFGVGYCVDGVGRYSRMAGRIYIPVYQNGKLFGWQGRLTNDNDRKSPKYYNYKFMHKSETLYNIDGARHYQTMVLVEGVTKVWRAGPNAVASFGAVPSATQAQLLHDALGDDGTLIVLPDGDTWIADKNGQFKIQRIMETLRQYIAPSQLVVIQMPADGDPGDVQVGILHQMLQYHLRQAGKSTDLFAKRTVIRAAPDYALAARRYVPT